MTLVSDYHVVDGMEEVVGSNLIGSTKNSSNTYRTNAVAFRRSPWTADEYHRILLIRRVLISMVAPRSRCPALLVHPGAAAAHRCQVGTTFASTNCTIPRLETDT